MLNPNGEQNPKLISILPQVPTWHAPTLVLHGGKDLLVSVQQANLLSESLEGANKPYRFVLYPNDGHRLPVEDRLSCRNLRIRLSCCCFLIAFRSCFGLRLCLPSFGET